MYSKAERLLITRFLFSKKTDGYISIFSWFSVIGIALGVSAIIVVMSVMNGFRNDLTKRLLGINSHLNIYSNINYIDSDTIEIINNNLSKNNYENILSAIETNGLIIKNDISRGVLIRGYDFIDNKHYLFDSIIEGSYFKNKTNEIIIGDSLASSINVKVGDQIKLAIPKSDKTILGSIPRFKTLKIIGIFDFGMYEYDSNLIFIHANLARKLILLDDYSYNQLEIFLTDPENAEKLKYQILNIIKDNSLNLFPVTWQDRNSSLINALKVEKNVMFLILTLIIIVASMNIISGLIIFVKEKNRNTFDKIIFLSKKNSGSIIEVILKNGFEVSIIDTQIKKSLKNNSKLKNEHEIIKNLLTSYKKNLNFLLIDHYDISSNYESLLRKIFKKIFK